MASAENFTLEDEEEPQLTSSQLSAPVGTIPPSASNPTPSPPSVLPPAPVALSTYTSIPRLPSHPHARMKAFHIDEDLGVCNLAQAVSVLRQNQNQIEDTEAQLQALLRTQARLVEAERLLEQQKLLDVLALGPQLGYDCGRPIAALLVYRCCLRWGSLSTPTPSTPTTPTTATPTTTSRGASSGGAPGQPAPGPPPSCGPPSLVDHLTALLLKATDEDGIIARHAAAAGAGGSSGGGVPESQEGAVAGAGVAAEGRSGPVGGARTYGGGVGCAGGEWAAAAAAAREVAYWLAVTSTLLALVDPHLPLLSPHPGAPPPHLQPHRPPGPHPHANPVATAVEDVKSSVSRAAIAAAAKVADLKERMGTTFSGLLNKSALMRRRSGNAQQPAPPQPLPAAAAGGARQGGAAVPGQQQGRGPGSEERGAAEEQPGEATATATATLPQTQPHLAAPPPASQSPVHAVVPSPTPSPTPGTAASPIHPNNASSSGYTPTSSQVFRQQLDLLAQKTYNQMRDTLKRHVSAVLPDCVQQPPTSVTSPRSPYGGAAGGSGGPLAARRSTSVSSGGAGEELYASAAAATSMSSGGAAARRAGEETTVLSRASSSAVPLQPWLDLIAVLAHHLELMRAAHVPRIVVRCLFKQTLSFVDVQLFNQLLLRPECCCTSNARYLVAGLQLLEGWRAAPRGTEVTGQGQPGAAATDVHTPPDAASAAAAAAVVAEGYGDVLAGLSEDLRHIRQAAHFLALSNKGALRLDDFIAMCPALNVQQLYRLATTFWDDCPPPPPPPSAQPPASPLPAQPATGVEGASAPAPTAAGEAPGEAKKEEEEEETGEKESAVAEGPLGEERVDGAATEQQLAGAEEEKKVEEDGSGNAVMEEAAAAVVAAAAAAAADEAGETAAAVATVAAAAAAASVSRTVSGEVLEEMKRRHAVANNGGLIVTFLLDDDSTALIAPGGVVPRELLRVINEPRLHAPLGEGLPAPLRSDDCPSQVFSFLLLPGAAAAGTALEQPVAPGGEGIS